MIIQADARYIIITQYISMIVKIIHDRKLQVMYNIVVVGISLALNVVDVLQRKTEVVILAV